MCIDNLGTSTRLSAPFPSYDFLQILYPNIYNALNVIDKGYKKGCCGEFKVKFKNIIYKENYNYVIAKEEDDSKRIEYIKSMGFIIKFEYKISPVNFSNIDVVSLNMNCSNGLHQFIQIKHGLKYIQKI